MSRAAAILIAIPLVSCFTEEAAAQAPDAQIAQCRRHAGDVLAALREDNLGAALQSLGLATDLSPGIHPVLDNGLPVAAGAIHRALKQRSTDEQYDLLYAWSMPTESRPTVRILSTMTPQDAPPREFARLIGERPRGRSFPVSEIGGVRGLFSTGWMLVLAAADVGRLSRLTTELEALTGQDVPNAGILLLLARIANDRSDATALTQALSTAANTERPAVTAPIDPSGMVLAAAALTREELRPVSEEILTSLVTSIDGRSDVRSLPFLRVARATAVQVNRGESGPEVLHEQRLKYWIPASGLTAALNTQGAARPVWLVHEDHILHLAGAGSDVLFFRYPLTGTFDFTCETQQGGNAKSNGGLVYGGLQFEALGGTQQLTIADSDFIHFYRRYCPFVRHEDRPIFHRVSIRSSNEGAVFAVNLHPMWFDHSASQTSPWLGLRALDSNRPLFRNLKFSGDPVIPREVRMTDGNELRGWQSQFFGELQPMFTTEAPETSLTHAPEPIPGEPDWRIEGGVIRGIKQEASAGVTSQSLLRYQRPLLRGETVAYEYYHQPGEYDVHPALGRLAFLIEPGGVRIHWITDGTREWTGLPEDNATLEPLNRRGPRPLPLQQDAWNRVAVQMSDDHVTLSLNDVVVYERPVEGGPRQFGFYRDRTQSAVKVRNVVMTGDWPESLPEELLEDPAVISDPQAAAGGRGLNTILGSESLAENVRAIRRAAAALDAGDRFEFLCRWVLPGPHHPDFRVAGLFTQTGPSPLARQLDPSIHRTLEGAQLVSPVYELLDTAAECGRLMELVDRISRTAVPVDELQQRARASLIVLAAMEAGTPDEGRGALEELHTLAEAARPQTLHEQWPEMLVVDRGLRKFPGVLPVGDLLTLL